MPRKPIRMAIVGCGGMAGAHVDGCRSATGTDLVACCDVDLERAESFAAHHHIPRAYDDYRKLMTDEPLDAVVSVTPDSVHSEVAMRAARHGLHILSEKPLATDLAEGRRMVRAVERAGVVNMVHFTYRNSSALHEAAHRIAKGHIGRVMHVEASYLQSWLTARYWGEWRTSPGWLWRLSVAHGSSGVLGDIGSHLYDATAFLAGDIKEIYCQVETFDKGMPGNRVDDYVLDANDSVAASLTFANGALGVFHATRWATGHMNSLRFRVFGDEGAVDIDLDDSFTSYRICKGRANRDRAHWNTVEAKPIPNLHQRFVRSIRTGKKPECDFASACRVQAYLDYSLKSDEQRAPVKVRLKR